MDEEELLQSAKKRSREDVDDKVGVEGMLMMSWMVGEMILTSHFNDMNVLIIINY